MNRVFDKVPAEMNFPAEEKDVLSFWREHRIFEKSIETSKGKPPFVFYEGPPTANGLPHNGHVLTRVIKDLFPRYKTMRGHFVGRKAGWDTHGLPVEVEVEKELRIHGKAAIEEYGVEPFIAKCIDSVFRYTREWEELTERIGFWVDLDDAYVTYHKSYVESVWWALSELFNKGLLYQGHKVVWWWAQGGTALSAAEVGQGYRSVDDPSVYVRFPLVARSGAGAPMEDGRSLVVWTTTPWTLSSNMYAAVKADVDYVTVDHAGQKLVMAAALREALAKKLKTDLNVLETFKGSSLVDLEYAPPFDTFKDSGHKWRVIAADFVTLDSGTGIVHIAPAFGEDDYAAHRKVAPNEAILCAVKSDGTFIDAMGKYAGRWVKEADKDLSNELKERGLLVHAEKYTHEYPFCPRAENDPLIQFARPAWYIRTTQEISRAIANNNAVHWLPEHIQEGRMGDFLRNNVDWALSRERYWGTPLNVWKCDRCGKQHAPASVAEIEKLNPNAFDHFKEAKKKDPSLNDHLIVHKPWIDGATFKCFSVKADVDQTTCAGTMRRVTEVIDCWFDSGAMPFAQWGYPHVAGSKEKFEANFPANFISEAIDQTRGWFYSLLMISTLVFPDRKLPHPYETCIVLGHVGDKEGKKESKSKGNYTPPDIVYDEVKLEFAVVGPEKLKSKPQPGTVFIAKEDLEGLDLLPGSMVEVQCGASMIEAIVQPDKGLSRRVAVLDAADLKRLGATPTKKADVKVAEVARLAEEERIVVRDPNTPAPGADAFRWFFYASSPPWSNTRHSLSNVRSLQKEFLVKLRNTYSFFVIYANIDGWSPAVSTGQGAPSELDRWCRSELHDTVRVVTERMDAYDVYGATQRLVDFVDALSNWYVRRSRERFWRSGMDDDKRAAYATLYDALTTVASLLAPFVPFTAERMYQNLVRKPLGDAAKESVHLGDWPSAAAGAIDEQLSTKMRAVRDLVSLGLQVRTQNKLKVRQPLKAAHVILSKPSLEKDLAGVIDTMKEELNVLEIHFVPVARAREFVEYQLKPNFRSLGQKGRGKDAQMLKGVMTKLTPEQSATLNTQLVSEGKITVEGVELAAEDVEVAFTTKEGFAAAGARVGVVALETALDDHLRELGFLRELQSKVQAMRKDLGLEFTDRIVLGLSGGPRLSGVLAKYKDDLAREVLATRVDVRDVPPSADPSTSASQSGDEREADVEGESVRISLLRAPSAASQQEP